MKVRELIGMIEHDSWAQVRTRGSHMQFTHPVKLGTVTASGKAGVESVRTVIDRFLATSASVRRDVAIHVLMKVRADA